MDTLKPSVPEGKGKALGSWVPAQVEAAGDGPVGRTEPQLRVEKEGAAGLHAGRRGVGRSPGAGTFPFTKGRKRPGRLGSGAGPGLTPASARLASSDQTKYSF